MGDGTRGLTCLGMRCTGALCCPVAVVELTLPCWRRECAKDCDVPGHALQCMHALFCLP